uniref:Endonuclease/exonuclease/phosphatase domain-containing protein n=1 Tax=Oryza brachyantha TaxID=4533 RepID=J3M5K5_ORYBR
MLNLLLNGGQLVGVGLLLLAVSLILLDHLENILILLTEGLWRHAPRRQNRHDFPSLELPRCGGAPRQNKMTYLRQLIRSTKAQVVFLSETHNSLISSDDISHNFHMVNSFVVPAQHTSGGLWIMWTNEMPLTIVSSSTNYILAYGVHKPSGIMFNLLCIYGDPTHNSSSVVWREAKNFVINSSHRPTFCMGDLNDILYANEKFGLSSVNNARISSFRHHVREIGLLDLAYRGPAYTWTNRRKGKDFVMQRLDRCLANIEWRNHFPNTAVYHLPLIYSDHAPILALLSPSTNRSRYYFKFEKWWLNESDFQGMAQTHWSHSGNVPFCVKLSNLSSGIKKWSKKKKPLQYQMVETEQKLLAIQASPNRHMLIDQELSLSIAYDSILQNLSDFYKQRAKKHWIEEGDRNTAFFQHAVQKRKHKNQISSLMINDNFIRDQKEISNCFVSFFVNLFSSSRYE